jgi:hypothetical protein
MRNLNSAAMAAGDNDCKWGVAIRRTGTKGWGGELGLSIWILSRLAAPGDEKSRITCRDAGGLKWMVA